MVVISADAMRTMMEEFGEDMVDKMKEETEKIIDRRIFSYLKEEQVRLNKVIQFRLQKERKIIFEQLGIIAGKMEKIDGQTYSMIAKMEKVLQTEGDTAPQYSSPAKPRNPRRCDKKRQVRNCRPSTVFPSLLSRARFPSLSVHPWRRTATGEGCVRA